MPTVLNTTLYLPYPANSKSVGVTATVTATSPFTDTVASASGTAFTCPVNEIYRIRTIEFTGLASITPSTSILYTTGVATLQIGSAYYTIPCGGSYLVKINESLAGHWVNAGDIISASIIAIGPASTSVTVKISIAASLDAYFI